MLPLAAAKPNIQSQLHLPVVTGFVKETVCDKIFRLQFSDFLKVDNFKTSFATAAIS